MKELDDYRIALHKLEELRGLEIRTHEMMRILAASRDRAEHDAGEAQQRLEKALLEVAS